MGLRAQGSEFRGAGLRVEGFEWGTTPEAEGRDPSYEGERKRETESEREREKKIERERKRESA